jgi:DNA-binding transcriptional LysR family regulator
MTLNRYEIFCKVIEMGSLTKAAEALNMTQSAVSHALKNFENEVGLPLILRERTGVKLTPMGQELYGSILSVLNANEQFQQHIARLKGLEVGTLKIATFSSVARVWMPTLLKMFQEKFPNVEVKLYIGYYHEIYDMIKTGIVDFGFLPETVSTGLNFEGLIDDPLRVVVNQDHPMSHLKSIPLSDLNDERFILPEWGLNHDVEQIIQNHHLKLNFRYKIQEDQTIVAMVRQGLGLSILPMLTLQNNTKDIAMIPLKENYQRFIGIGYSTTSLSPVAKQFMSMTRSWLDKSTT